MSNPLLELDLDTSLYPGSQNNPQIPSDSLLQVAPAGFSGTLSKEEPVEEEMTIVSIVNNVPPESPPPVLPIVPGEVLFTYIENAAAHQQLVLGDKLANSYDTNPQGILVFESIDSISIEHNAKIPDLTATVVNAIATPGQDAVYILSDCYGTATITIDTHGIEIISDPNNIFRDLNTGDVLTVKMIYTMADQFGQEADSMQTIEIFGFGQGIVCNPDFFTTTENAGFTIDATMGKLANDTDVDTVPHLLVIDGTDAASTVESNLVITGGFGLLTVGQINVSDVVNIDPTVVHEYK
ncbi:MAG: hypothetical protein P0107_09815, partial [Nitrosomonas sp.]|nr:hypothetical protein [Nitrosomonas sp.]